MLLTPGPTPVPEFVRKAMMDKTIHHRTPEFEMIFKETRELLFQLYEMDEVVLVASSGSGAMEACVTNFTHKKALVINSGKFGERFSKICEAFNINYSEIKNEWDTPVEIKEVISLIKEDKDIDAIFIQICESSGGLRHPVEQISKEVKKINKNITIVADGITAIAVEKIDTSNIDAIITGSQKALMLPPGLSIIGLSNRAVLKIEKRAKGFYFNLATEIKKQKRNTTAWTAATTLIIGLKEILFYIKENIGFKKLFEDTQKRSIATKKALTNIGLDIYPKTPAVSMSTIYSEKANEIRKILKNKYNINIAGGQDHLKGKIFRINHMGLVEDYETSWVVNAIELALDELSLRNFDGSANRVFLSTMFKT